MGVSGAGKTTVGRLLAETLAWPFFDADDFHPETNRQKMADGQPLDDDDRKPWLERLRTLIHQRLSVAGPAVVTCSALKEQYRAFLEVDDPRVVLVHLSGSPQLLLKRLREREGHFMPPELLASQLETLEPPGEQALTLDISSPPLELCRQILQALRPSV